LFHSKVVAPLRLQSVTMTELKEFPADSDTSKYVPDAAKLGDGPGFDAYWATVSPPIPLPVTVVPSLAAVAEPVALSETSLAELVEPAGAGGATGATENVCAFPSAAA
jgi:hypothetical protein